MTDQQENKIANDPWEEEIDLRELMRGIAKKWYIWLGLPFLVMVFTAGYLLLFSPPAYEVEAELWFDDIIFSSPEARSLLPEKSRLRRRMTSISKYTPLYREVFADVIEFEDDEASVRSFRSFLREDVELEIGERQVDLQVKSSYPEATAKFLARWLKTVRQREKELIIERTKRTISQVRRNLQNVRTRHEDWIKTVVGTERVGVKEEQQYNWFREMSEFLPAEVQLLEINSEFASRIAKLEEKLQELKDFSKDLEGQIYEYYPPELPAERLPGGRRRKTLLAGVVTGLLALFGTAFWEIL